MKYSKSKQVNYLWLKYTKVLCLKSIFILLMASCGYGGQPQSTIKSGSTIQQDSIKIETGADRLNEYLPSLKSKAVGIVGNQTSVIEGTHLVDSLLALDVNIVKVYSPEHGFRGQADAGEKVSNNIDEKTSLPIISLYGKNKKPSIEQLEGIQLMIFDIQDVGARFYTYISTLHYVMEACAENKIPLLVLDRPNPNGNYVDGPVLESEFKSFVGMHPVPIVHGMTIGEYAMMINGEGWLEDSLKCDLTVVKCMNYKHSMSYSLPIPPSPNLRSDLSIVLYPSLCLLEGTSVTVGRGTDGPFERYGHPQFKGLEFSFTPKPGYGSKTPKFNGEKCWGVNLADSIISRPNRLNLQYIIHANQLLDGKLFDDKKKIFNLLAGNDKLWRQIKAGMPEDEIRKSWEPELSEFKKIRSKYLLYE